MSSTCSTVSRALHEPVAGTAATARTWLLLEQPGPWGAKALTSSHLDPALGRALEAAAKGTGVRIALIRRPGRHADSRMPATRRVYVAHTVPGDVRLHSATTTDPARLLDLDFPALGRGETASFDAVLGGAPHDGDPLALVCTNGKRDRCCALLGRPSQPSWRPPVSRASGRSPTSAVTASPPPCWCCRTATPTGGRRRTR